MLSIVIPCYNEEAVIEKTYNRLINVINGTDYKFEIIFVNDGSKDGTLDILKNLNDKSNKHIIKIINLARNFGQMGAIKAGINNAEGEAVIIIDADLQDPPEFIPEMIDKWQEGFDIVYGQRLEREGESEFKKNTASIFYRILNFISDVKIPVDTGEFRLLDRKVVKKFNTMTEKQKYIRGMFAWLGYKSAPVYFNRNAREDGETKYSLKMMLKLANDGIFNFSKKPLLLPFLIGFPLVIFSFLGLLINIIRFNKEDLKFFVILFVLGLSLLSNFITNKYVETIDDNVRNRPDYIIDEIIYLP